jgi:hypothetical protein
MIKMKKKIESLREKLKTLDFNDDTTEETFLKESLRFNKEKKLLLESEVDN